jgi:hypothetical protein
MTVDLDGEALSAAREEGPAYLCSCPPSARKGSSPSISGERQEGNINGARARIEGFEIIQSERLLCAGEGGKNEDDEYFDLLPGHLIWKFNFNSPNRDRH